jgi:hypothetical protein
MDTYEQLVQTYLTVVEKCAVIPQFPILFDQDDKPWSKGHRISWSAYPDFLAVDFLNRQVQIVEVTKALSSKKPEELVEKLLAHRERIERYVRWFTNDYFPLCWRYFVRDANKDKLHKELTRIAGSEGQKWQVTALEDVFDELKRVMP